MNTTMSMADQDYLRQQLEWVNTRMKALDRITLKLTEMKKIAEYAKENARQNPKSLIGFPDSTERGQSPTALKR